MSKPRPLIVGPGTLPVSCRHTPVGKMGCTLQLASLILLGPGCTGPSGIETGASSDSSDSSDSGGSSPGSTVPVFEEVASNSLSFGSTWCGLGYDGEQLVITTETGGDIWGAPFDLDGTMLAPETQLVTQADAGNQQIADHVHRFEDGHHFIAYSISGTGQGGDLFIVKLDTELERQDLVQLLDDEPPTNDMLMVSDGETLSVGVLEPGVGHHVIVLDLDLETQQQLEIGSGDAIHANGAGAVFVDGRTHILAPMTLAPGKNDQYIHMEFDADWELLSSAVVLSGDGELGMVSALSYLPEHDLFVAHYADGTVDSGGDITRLVFDSQWEVLDQRVVLEGTWTRTRSLLVDDRLFWCADGLGEVQLTLLDLVDAP